jgi:hypothetical protein
MIVKTPDFCASRQFIVMAAFVSAMTSSLRVASYFEERCKFHGLHGNRDFSAIVTRMSPA